MANGNTRVKHRERLTSVLSTVAYTVSSFPMNAGTTFEWLKSIARAYESWKIHSLKIQYVPNAASTASGSVYLIYDYDPQDSKEPLTSEQATSKLGTKELRPWSAATYIPIVSKMMGGVLRKYVNIPGETDEGSKRSTDIGCFYCATEGGLDTGSGWGKIFVEYDIEFMTPTARSSEVIANMYSQTITNVSNGAPSVNSANMWVNDGDSELKTSGGTAVELMGPGGDSNRVYFKDTGTYCAILTILADSPDITNISAATFADSTVSQTSVSTLLKATFGTIATATWFFTVRKAGEYLRTRLLTVAGASAIATAELAIARYIGPGPTITFAIQSKFRADQKRRGIEKLHPAPKPVIKPKTQAELLEAQLLEKYAQTSPTTHVDGVEYVLVPRGPSASMSSC